MTRHKTAMGALDLLRKRAKILELGRLDINKRMRTVRAFQTLLTARKRGQNVKLVQRTDLERRATKLLPRAITELACHVMIRTRVQTRQTQAIHELLLAGHLFRGYGLAFVVVVWRKEQSTVY